MAPYTLKNGACIEVDEDVLPRMQGRTWNQDKDGLVVAFYRDRETKKVTRLPLTTLIFGGPPARGTVRIHGDGDRLNYRRTNLLTVPKGKHHTRGVSHQDDLTRRGRAIAQSLARGGYVGVSRRGQRFYASIQVGGKPKHLGSFETAEDAARAYDRALDDLGYEPVNESRIQSRSP